LAPAFFEFFHLAVVDGAHDHRHVRAQVAGGAQDAKRTVGSMKLMLKRARLHQSGGQQHVAARGVAVHHLLAASRASRTRTGSRSRPSMGIFSFLSIHAMFWPLRP